MQGSTSEHGVQPGLRLALVIGSLGAGGAERVLAGLATHLARRGHAVRLVTLASADADFHAVGAGVERVGLGLTGASGSGPLAPLGRALGNLRRARALRSAIEAHAPDLVLSFLPPTNVLSVLAARRSGVPVVVSERIDPRRHRLRAPWNRLVRPAYRRAAHVVANSEAVASELATWLAPERVSCLPNFVETPAPDALAAEPELPLPIAPFAVSVGRLHAQKGHDVALRALLETETPWNLVLLGDGDERGALEELARVRGLEDRVVFAGRVRHPERIVARADAFLLASRYEGVPNALLEALAIGRPCVATNTGTGAVELLTDERDGLLVPVEDPGAIARALDRLAVDPELAARTARAGRERVQAFTPEAIVPRWEELLVRVARGAAQAGLRS